MSEGQNPGGQLPPPIAAGTGFGPPDVGSAAAPTTGHAAGGASAEVGGNGSSMGHVAGEPAQRASDVGQTSGATRTHQVAERASRVKRWRHMRPRAQLGVIGGAAAGAALVVAGVAVATRDDPPGERPAAVETTIEIAPTDAAVTTDPIVTVAASVTPTTAAPTTAAATTAAPTTAVETTSTAEPTTTVAALPSGAGSYAVVGGEIVVSGSLVNGVVGTADSQTWLFSGQCDGVGDCSITVEGTTVASTTAASPLPLGGTIVLAAAGPGAYLVASTIEIPDCGSGLGTMTIALVDATLNGQWSVTFPGGESCPFTTLSTTYTGTRS